MWIFQFDFVNTKNIQNEYTNCFLLMTSSLQLADHILGCDFILYIFLFSPVSIKRRIAELLMRKSPRRRAYIREIKARLTESCTMRFSLSEMNAS